MMADEFARKHSEGECVCVDEKVVVKGLPLPEIRRTEEAGPNATNGSYATNCEEQESISVEQESIFEVDCHIPDTIRDLQLSQQNAIASRREQRNAGYAQRVEKFRAILNLAEGRGAWNERIDAHLEEMFVGLTNDIASEKENQKRSSEFAFPETGRSNKRVEKRKKALVSFQDTSFPRVIQYIFYTTNQLNSDGLVLFWNKYTRSSMLGMTVRTLRTTYRHYFGCDLSNPDGASASLQSQ
ncbi:hypothetical protein IV203_032547 [Nitzschia inconspicua]|uniref:Uncharacterized protein n=1 Tax=Nitzschia inconspicua TaxID=303405 RepID=A0A9K3KKK4_9STRA|nr:hypothetical protein IV203_032547 [Nitzschia inconspicua]